MTKPHPGGRPPKYEPKFAEQASKLCKLGATDYELADFFGVHTVTIYRWKNTHDEFCKAVKVGKEFSDDRVERSLYNRAVGYTFESEKVFQFQGEVVRAQINEHVPPDTGAAFNWLKNRRPDDWRDTKTIAGDPDNPIAMVPVLNVHTTTADDRPSPPPKTINGSRHNGH